GHLIAAEVWRRRLKHMSRVEIGFSQIYGAVLPVLIACLSRVSTDARRTSNTRLERTRHERASLLSCVGEPLKRSVLRLPSVRKVVVTLLELNPHEEMFIRSFVVGEKRPRYLSFLDSERGRKKILASFHHCRDLDSRFAQRIPNNQQSAQSI